MTAREQLRKLRPTHADLLSKYNELAQVLLPTSAYVSYPDTKHDQLLATAKSIQVIYAEIADLTIRLNKIRKALA